MNILKKFLLIGMILITCGGITNSRASAYSEHCGDLSSNEFWSATQNVHVVTCDVVVPFDHTLTVDAGAIVKFEIGRRLIIDGTLIVQGTYENPAHFTSIRDDSLGGDTNGDGGGSYPEWDNWQGILFRESSSDAHSIIENAVIRYGGYSWQGNITLSGASPSIQNTTLSDGHLAILADLRSFPLLDNNIYEDNHYNALGYEGGTVESNAVWSMTDTSYFIMDDVYVGNGATLRIRPGTVIKFEFGRRLIVDGTLRITEEEVPITDRLIFLPLITQTGAYRQSHALPVPQSDEQLNTQAPVSTTAEPVYFTSIRDDTVGGDTNGDGGSSTPGWDNWQGILFRDSSNDANSLIDNTVIRYAGYSWQGNITLNNASPTIQNTTLSDGHMAIRADLGSLPTLNNNIYQDNNYNALGYDGGTVNSNTTWSTTDTSILIIDDVYVGTGTTLTIQPGVIVKFNLYSTRLVVDGTLRVLGTASEKVTFTSIRDDSVGGDTNGDGGASTPDWDNWRGILFRDGSDDANSLIDNAVIRYGGNSWGGNITLESASPTIQNTTLSDGHMAIRADLGSHPTLSGNIYQNNSWNALGYDGGTVNSDTTWSITDTSIFITNDVYVGTGITLTINPGVIVKFNLYSTRLVVDGTLRVLGTAGEKVTFTSIRDDSIGGDTNGDGGASTPDWDNWRGILFRNSSDDANSLVDYAVIRYGGNSWGGNITLESASPTIQNTTLSDGHMPIRADLRSLPTLSNNSYQDNNINAFNYFGGTIDADTTWSITDTVYYLEEEVYVGTGTTLTIQPGVIVKFNLYSTRLVVDGTLRVLGTASEKVNLTSIRDDSVGGDTNGDGGASTPDWDNWRGILFRDGSDDANSLIDNAVIRYGGNSWQGNITLESASPTIQHSTLSDGSRGIRADNSQPQLICNNIQYNEHYGIDNTTPLTTITALNQWWGNPSGPFHSTNPGGSGNAVTDGVSFDPWSLVPCDG